MLILTLSQNRHFCSILIALSFGLSMHAEPIIIGYTKCIAVTNYTQAMMDHIGNLKWYFAHASVGENMMQGVAALLHQADPGFYRLTRQENAEIPGSPTASGTIYDYNRGNPGWLNKITLFETSVNNGWCFPKINIVMNKFCFIDAETDLNVYLNSMTNLEAAHQETLFVYMTIPLTTAADADNYARNTFNDALRDWVITNNRVLFDMADIEAHDTNGAEVTFTWNDQSCERLCDDYSSDGGHLNDRGMELAGWGFYALAAGLFASDRDGDGANDGDELIAGTCPTDRQSVLKLDCQRLPRDTNCILRWPASSNRFYTLQGGSGLAPGLGFSNLATDLPATPPTNFFTNWNQDAQAYFYRVQVTQ